MRVQLMSEERQSNKTLLHPSHDDAKPMHTLFSLRARILSSKSWRILSCSQKMLSLTCKQEQNGKSLGGWEQGMALGCEQKVFGYRTTQTLLEVAHTESGLEGSGGSVHHHSLTSVSLSAIFTGFRLRSLRRSRPVIWEMNNLKATSPWCLELGLRKES
jgi:hypothetical protein